jgi:death-on-curing protein
LNSAVFSLWATATLRTPDHLEHVLVEIRGSLFGQELYPTVYEKAALLGWRIITGHIFHDGNKRTGMESCRLFLDLNGYDMRIDQEVVDVALKVATNEVKFEDFVRWVEERTTPKPPTEPSAHNP